MEPKARVHGLWSQLTEIDGRLAEAIEERAKVAKEIRRLDAPAGFTVSAERERLTRLVEERPDGELSKGALLHLFEQVAATTRAASRLLRVAYLGPEGGLCHQMAKLQFGIGTVFVECATVSDALEEVRRQRAAFCTFPFDSSVEGLSVSAVSALAETDLVMVGERSLSATLALMAANGKDDAIAHVYSTSAGHTTSELFRKRNYPNAAVVDVRSPVEAVRRAKEDPEGAAIVPEACGRESGLLVVKENVGDEPELRCRYAIVGSRPASRTGKDTTSLLFSLDDAPGTLFRVLEHFADRGINLKKIQSRPVRGASWAYVFYVEVAGHVTDRAVVTAVEAVKGSTKYLKLLGSFASDD